MTETGSLDWPRGQARYMVLAEELANSIGDGQYGVGDFLPVEAQLCESYGVSRYTAREAIRELKRRGLVETQHGVGTQVLAKRPELGLFRYSFDTVDEFIGIVDELGLVVVATEHPTATTAQAAVLDCAVGDTYLAVSGYRQVRRSGQTVAYTELWIPEAFADVAPQIGQDRTAVGKLIERRYKLRTARIHQTMEPTELPANIAATLGALKGDPGLLVQRTYLDTTERIFMHARSWHGGEHGRLHMDIHRGEEAV